MEYYEHTCRCGCGGKIEKKPWHKYQGIPDYIPYHQHRCRNEETRIKMSEAKKGQIPWNKGTKGLQTAWNKGKKFPEFSGKNSSRYKHGKSKTREYNNQIKQKQQNEDDPRFVYSRLKSHLKRKGALMDWEKNDFIDWYNLQEKICHYCGIKIKKYSGKSGPQRDTISIDRKNPKGPYSKSNCILCCMKCNIVKNNIITYEQMCNIVGPLIKKNREEKS